MGISKSQSLWSNWFRDRSVPFIGFSGRRLAELDNQSVWAITLNQLLGWGQGRRIGCRGARERASR